MKKWKRPPVQCDLIGFFQEVKLSSHSSIGDAIIHQRPLFNPKMDNGKSKKSSKYNSKSKK